MARPDQDCERVTSNDSLRRMLPVLASEKPVANWSMVLTITNPTTTSHEQD